MEIHSLVATVIGTAFVIGILGLALMLFAGMFALLTTAIFGRIIE